MIVPARPIKIGFFFVDGMGLTTKMAATGGWDGEDDKWDQILWFCILHYSSLLPDILEREGEREREKEGWGVVSQKRGCCVG